MKKFKLDNLYESPYPPENTRVLWADVDESTGKLRAIHKYNESSGQWEPILVSVDYMKPEDGNDKQLEE